MLFNMLSRFVMAFLSGSLLISWLQSPSVLILKPKKIKPVTVPIVSLSICHEVMGLHAMILVFWMLSFKPAFSLSSFTFIKRLFNSSLISVIRVVSSADLRLLIFLPENLISGYASSSLAFHMMYSAYKLNKQGDNMQPWRTPFPIWNKSVVPCLVLTVASWSTYRFLSRLLLLSRFSHVWLCATPEMTAHQAPPSLGFSRQEPTGVGCHFLLQCMKVKMKSLSCVQLLVTSWTVAYEAPPSMGFSRQEYWSGVPLPSPTFWTNEIQNL